MEKVNYKNELDFVNEVAEDCIRNLDTKQREYLMDNPCAIDYHFTYCMYIRNRYIHKRDFSDVPFYAEPDYLSGKVMEMIIAKLLPEEYLYDDSFTEMLYRHKGFIKIRKEYKKIYGEYPVEIMQRYREEVLAEQKDLSYEPSSDKELDWEKWHERFQIDYEKQKSIIIRLLQELAEKVWRTVQLKEIALECGVEYEEISPKIEEIKNIFFSESEYIPVESCLLPFKKQIGEARYISYRNMLSEQIEDNPRLIKKLDAAYFVDRVLAKVALKFGWALQYLPMYQDDEEMVRYSLTQDGTAIEYASARFQKEREWVKFAIEHSQKGTIMSLDCMKTYRKDKELVYLACKMKRWNLVYVDKAFLDDFELAKLCLEQIGEPNSIYSYLSERLRNNKELAMLDLQENHTNIEAYSATLRDDDEIAEKLYELHGPDAWGWNHMSERLKKKYGVLGNKM